MPASQRRLGSVKKASLLKGFEPVDVWPLLADVDEEPEALSSSALRSFEGDRLMLLLPSIFFSGGTSSWGGAGVGLAAGGEADELDRRNKFGAWLEELMSGTSG